MSRRVKKVDVDNKDSLEQEQRHDSHSVGTDSVRDNTSHSVVLSIEDKQDLVSMLMPKIEGFITKTIDARFKELEPSKENAGIAGLSSSNPIVCTTGGGSTPTGANPPPDLTKLISQVSNAIGQPSATGESGQTEGQPNPLAALLGGAAGGNPVQGMILQLIMKELGLGQQQVNPMAGMMPELMMRAFMEDISFSSTLKKLALSSLFKNPQLAQEFSTVSNNLVGDHVSIAADLMSRAKEQKRDV